VLVCVAGVEVYFSPLKAEMQSRRLKNDISEKIN
jgi:hypothetical protein